MTHLRFHKTPNSVSAEPAAAHYEHIVIVECKYLNRSVERAHVDELARTIEELNASKGVIFSSVGFQSGAVTQAKHDGIDLFQIRELTDAEWGLPGRHVSIYLHVIGTSIWNNAFPGAVGHGYNLNPNINLSLGNPPTDSYTPIAAPADVTEKTLEALIYRVSRVAADQLRGHPQILFGGADGVRRIWRSAKYVPPSPIIMPVPTGRIIVPVMTFDVGLEINQSHIQVDRGKDQIFALALDDCIRGVVVAASRRKDDQYTTLTPLAAPFSPPPTDQVVQNDSILSVGLVGFCAANQFDGLAKGIPHDTVSSGNSPALMTGR